MGSVAAHFIHEGWRPPYQEITREAEKYIEELKRSLEQKGEKMSDETKDEIKRREKIIELADGIKSFGIIGTLY